jgi:hypothetical protein
VHCIACSVASETDYNHSGAWNRHYIHISDLLGRLEYQVPGPL